MPTDPLAWNVPIVNEDRTPTPEFMTKWQQQARTNGSIPTLDTPEEVSAVLDVIGGTRGSLLVRTLSGWQTLAPGTAGRVLTAHGAGNDPSYADLPSVQDYLDSITNVRGSVLYRGAAGWQALAPGTAGQVLQTNGAGADPSWGASGGGSPKWGFSGTGLVNPAAATATAAPSGYGGNPQNAILYSATSSFYWGNALVSPTITFDFGTAVVIAGIMMQQNNNAAQGNWQAAGSNNNVAYTNLGSPQAWGGALISAITFANSTAYRYYRLAQTSGATSNSPYQQLFLFRWV